MTTRERWIVYPLLFLALGVSLRDKFVPPKSLAAGKIMCDELVVHGDASLPVAEDFRARTIHCDLLVADQSHCQIAQAGVAQSRAVTVTGGKGVPVILLAGGAADGQGRIELRGPDGKRAVVLAADAQSGAGSIETFTQDGFPQVRLSSAHGRGLVATVDADSKLQVVLGHILETSGLFFVAPELSRPQPLAWPIPRLPARPSGDLPMQPPEVPGAPEAESPRSQPGR